MTGETTVTNLLGIFQECKKRGEKASLFLETRNGDEFATFRINLSASHTLRTPEKPPARTKMKSPSTLRRDRMRLDKYRTKSLEKSWNPVKTSTPAPALKPKQTLETSTVAMETFNDENQDSVTPILDSKAEENTIEKIAERTNDDDNARKDDENGYNGEKESAVENTDNIKIDTVLYRL